MAKIAKIIYVKGCRRLTIFFLQKHVIYSLKLFQAENLVATDCYYYNRSECAKSIFTNVLKFVEAKISLLKNLLSDIG